jgi:hypothetical protein
MASPFTGILRAFSGKPLIVNNWPKDQAFCRNVKTTTPSRRKETAMIIPDSIVERV